MPRYGIGLFVMFDHINNENDQLLHLHPLTLEDILQQDPREKLELFPKLGYYFISFRAIESRRTRERYNLGTAGMERDRIVDQGIVSEVNVYLIVFREGIVSVSITSSDIGAQYMLILSKVPLCRHLWYARITEVSAYMLMVSTDHTDAVRNRVLMRNETATMSSGIFISYFVVYTSTNNFFADWIAHGIMDSIVDSFFPFLDEIDKEVTDIESLVYASGPGSSLSSGDPLSPTASNSSSATTATPQEKSSDDEKPDADLVIKKEDTIQSAAAKTHFSLPHRRRFSFRRVTQAVEVVKSLLRRGVNARKLGPTMTTRNVRRMARARRLVTSLTRFLHTKSEVVTQIKKRLLKTGEFGLGNGTGDDQDVFVYMGDVQGNVFLRYSNYIWYSLNERKLLRPYSCASTIPCSL